MDSDKQTEEIIYYLKNIHKMEYVKYCIPVNLRYTMLHNDKHIANGGHLSQNDKQ